MGVFAGGRVPHRRIRPCRRGGPRRRAAPADRDGRAGEQERDRAARQAWAYSPVVEFHTGEYAHAEGEARAAELRRLTEMAALASKNGIEPHAGHGRIRRWSSSTPANTPMPKGRPAPPSCAG